MGRASANNWASPLDERDPCWPVFWLKDCCGPCCGGGRIAKAAIFHAAGRRNALDRVLLSHELVPYRIPARSLGVMCEPVLFTFDGENMVASNWLPSQHGLALGRFQREMQ